MPEETWIVKKVFGWLDWKDKLPSQALNLGPVTGIESSAWSTKLLRGTNNCISILPLNLMLKMEVCLSISSPESPGTLYIQHQVPMSYRVISANHNWELCIWNGVWLWRWQDWHYFHDYIGHARRAAAEENGTICISPVLWPLVSAVSWFWSMTPQAGFPCTVMIFLTKSQIPGNWHRRNRTVTISNFS